MWSPFRWTTINYCIEASQSPPLVAGFSCCVEHPFVALDCFLLFDRFPISILNSSCMLEWKKNIWTCNQFSLHVKMKVSYSFRILKYLKMINWAFIEKFSNMSILLNYLIELIYFDKINTPKLTKALQTVYLFFLNILSLHFVYNHM